MLSDLALQSYRYTSVLSLIADSRGLAWYDRGAAGAFWSEPKSRFLGLDQDASEPRGDAIMRRILPEDRDRLRRAWPQGDPKNVEDDQFVELRVTLHDGQVVLVHFLLYTRGGRDGEWMAMGISRLADAERPLVEFPQSPLGWSLAAPVKLDAKQSPPFAVFDGMGRLVDANSRACLALVGEHRRPPPIDIADYARIVFGLERGVGRVRSLIASGQEGERVLGSAGNWWRVTAVPLYSSVAGASPLVMLVGQETTSLIDNIEGVARRESQLKRTLVREAHHRIRNHLQGLVGLLRVVGASKTSVQDATDSAVLHTEAIAAINDVIARDHRGALALIGLVHELARQSSARGGPPLQVSMDPDDAECSVQGDHAVAIGLILKELLANASRHTAVSPAAAIAVRIHRLEEHVLVEIRNSPAVLALPTPQLSIDSGGRLSGLDLVRMLLPRPGATFEISEESPQCVVARLTLGAGVLLSTH